MTYSPPARAAAPFPPPLQLLILLVVVALTSHQGASVSAFAPRPSYSRAAAVGYYGNDLPRRGEYLGISTTELYLNNLIRRFKSQDPDAEPEPNPDPEPGVGYHNNFQRPAKQQQPDPSLSDATLLATRTAAGSLGSFTASAEEYASTIYSNTVSGPVGRRGELFVVAQFLILLCLALGTVPVVGDYIVHLVGPGLIGFGLSVVCLAAFDLGGSLSPWPVPAEGRGGAVAGAAGAIRRDGLYEYVRHPMYSGLLCGMAGLSVYTDSALRLLLTVALFYALDRNASFEEEKLAEKFPEYEAYREAVRGKFVPQRTPKSESELDRVDREGE